MNDRPYLSVVAVSRNDDHGGNLRLRMQLFVNGLAAQAERHRLKTELILVEWNPPADRPALREVLDFPRQHPYCSMRIIEVPAALHARYRHAKALPVYQMIAKNVGLRRARGRFVLATNVDVVFSDALFSRLAARDLGAGRCYRSIRHDVDHQLTPDMPIEAVLDYCQNHLIRVNLRDCSLNVRDGSRHSVYAPGRTEAQLGHPKLFTNACGDFTLMAREDWHRLRGYAELDMFSFHLDSLFLYCAHYSGIQEHVFPETAVHYHIEHLEGWTPEIHRAQTLDAKLDEGKISRLNNTTLRQLQNRLRDEPTSRIINPPNWGLVDEPLPETPVTMADWERAQSRDSTSSSMKENVGGTSDERPYLSIVVTARNDDHGGNQLARFQIFLDHLGEMCARHHLAAELIVVEWNPDASRPPLAQALRWPGPAQLPVRIITVPAEIHQTLRHADKFPLFQMFAKNVGVRRARGEYVLATNIDILFSDELTAWLAEKELRADCFYRIDRHDVGEATIPQGLSRDEVLAFCADRVVRIHGQHGTYTRDQQPPSGDARRLHTNACGDFTLMARAQWERLKGYPEFELWSIYLDGLLIHAAHATGLTQRILRAPLRIYHIEHSLGWAVNQNTTTQRPSLDYVNDYRPLCQKILKTGKPLEVNSENWGLMERTLVEQTPGVSELQSVSETCGTGESQAGLSMAVARSWIDAIASAENRLYYRDQSAQTMLSLARYAREIKPTVVVELGTLSGLSLRTWTASTEQASIYAIDLSFQTLHETLGLLPADLSRVTLLEQDILKTNFPSLWTAHDKVIFFVDAHDLPGVPIMEYVLTTALPSLPEGSMVIVDDLWFSPERLTHHKAQAFLDHRVVEEIDELQCFEGHYAPYHGGGSFMGFAEVIPLLKFVNAHGIPLVYEEDGKHVSFVWKSAYLSPPRPIDAADSADCYGSVVHNPLVRVPVSPSLQETMRRIATDYRQRRIGPAAESLANLIEQHPRDPGLAYSLAVCFARCGRLAEARDILGRIIPDSDDPHCHRLFNDLVERVGPCPSERPAAPAPRPQGAGLTLFAVPKPFVGHNDVIQRNAIRSWARLDPAPEIILFGDEPGIREIAEEVGARHQPHVECNEFGTPLVNKLFEAAQRLASNRVLAYVNADMILFDDFIKAVQTVQTRFSTFLLIGRRWDFTLLDELEFAPGWQESLRREATEEGMLHAECGLDYFVFTPEVYPEIPPFAIGRTAWDNWLVRSPRTNGVPVIDGTEAVVAIHQDHHYGHVDGGRKEAWSGVEAQRNRSLAGQPHGYGYTSGAAWVLDKNRRPLQVQPHLPEFISPPYRARRCNWLARQARRLMAVESFDLAACRWEEALVFLDKLVEDWHSRGFESPLLGNAGIDDHYKAACALLAQCYVKLDRDDQAAAAYTRLLEAPCVHLEQELREEVLRVRDRLQHHPPSDSVRSSVSNSASPATVAAAGTDGRAKIASYQRNDPEARRSTSVPSERDGASSRYEGGPEAERAGTRVGPALRVDSRSAVGGLPKVSVVTACRNSQTYLPECLDSILRQTMPEWELLLIDDGSTDNTRRIIEDYARRDDRIKACCFDDSAGPYIRRNFAIRQARSPFIVIQDADDIMLPHKLQTLHEAISRDDRLGVVGSFYRKFLDEFRGIRYTEPVALVLTHEQIQQVYQTQMIWDFTWHGSAIFWKRLFDEIGPYDENPFGADSFWLAKAAEYARRTGRIRLSNIPEFLTLRRMHDNSQTGVLPPADPRGRRARYWKHCLSKLQQVSRWAQENPQGDVARALRECTCGDFLTRFRAQIIAWEAQPLDNRVVPHFLRAAVTRFNDGHYVSCVRALRDVETLEPGVSHRVVHFNLLRAMALMGLGLETQSLQHLECELDRHNSPAARQFYEDHFQRGLRIDVRQWCGENAERYNLGLFESKNAESPSLSADMKAASEPSVAL